MVRVISQNFSHPRSRHSSGETDLDLAMRADSALSTLGAKRIDIPDYESSSDSFWDSELDTDQQDQLAYQKGSTEDEINGNGTSEKSDVHTKRKERRRERNKVSAQAYRQRRRQVNVSTQQELTILEERNKQLLKQVHDLEQQTEQVKQVLKGRCVSVPDFMYPKATSCLSSTTTSSGCSSELQTITASPDHSLSPPCPSHATPVNSNSPLWDFGKLPKNVSHIRDFPVNANHLKVSPINLNALEDSGTAATVSEALPSPSVVGGTTYPSAKPKQNLFNANHCYKIPIHHQKVLRTVHEIPSNIPSGGEEEYVTLSNQSVCNSVGTKATCDDLGNCNNNMNLVNSNERMNSNLMKDEKIWNGSFHMNPLKAVNMNDNKNSSLSKSHLQSNPPSLLHPKNYVQLIISSGENAMPSQ